MASRSLAFAALLLASASACAAGDCLPPPGSAERVALRWHLHPLVHRSQCPGPPTPSAFHAQELELSSRKEALLARIRSSRVAEDLARVEREDEEANRYVNEADCSLPFAGRPEDPKNIATYPALIEADRRELAEAEAAFNRAVAACRGR